MLACGREKTSRIKSMNEIPQSVVKVVEVNGIDLQIADYESSVVTADILRDLKRDDYNIDNIDFSPGDVVIDIGANIGIISVYIAKRYPLVRIYAYEPIPDNYKHLLKNIELNNAKNVTPCNMAITNDGRSFGMTVHMSSNSGGATGYLEDMNLPGHRSFMVDSMTLGDVFEKNGIERCRLLKIDCEGAEHEILMGCNILNRMDYLSGEFHINRRLRRLGYSIKALVKHCGKYINLKKIKVTKVCMAE